MKQINFKKYSGYRIRGKCPIEETRMFKHLDNASKLTSMVESGGKYGTVISYDGTGMTAGIHQAIAVYPKASSTKKGQGPLWKLLARMMSINPGILEFINILEILHGQNLMLNSDGVVRDTLNGERVTGDRIRKAFGTPNGVLSNNAEDRTRAQSLARLFHELFSNPLTFGIQQEFGKLHFIKSARRHKMRFSSKLRNKELTIHKGVYSTITRMDITALNSDNMPIQLDIAMSFFWSYYVNAPSMAVKKLCQVYDRYDRRDKKWHKRFPKALIKKLGTSSYGRWDDDIDSGRYQRTRNAMLTMWPEEHFTGRCPLVPKNFIGA